MTSQSLRIWSLVHKWTSLVCTLFLLLLCLTGLPLLFKDQIDTWLSHDPPYAEVPAGAPRADLDGLVGQALARYPHEVVRFVFIDDDEPKVLVGLAPAQDSAQRLIHSVKFDAHTGTVLADQPADAKAPMTFMTMMLRLHVDLFAGLPGSLFLAVMGLLFAAAIVSGVVLYAPFMRKLPFGAVRKTRSTRVRWLDLHNLLGVVSVAWMLVVGLTGVLNDFALPLFSLWRSTEVAALIAADGGKAVPRTTATAQGLYDTVHATVPRNTIVSITYPTTGPFGSPAHFLVWTKGDTPLTARLFTPVLLDGETGGNPTALSFPWYLRALELSRPLHFGDYGGTPLKIIWVVLDCLTIVVLGSGLYLWLRPKRARAGEEDPIMALAEVAE